MYTYLVFTVLGLGAGAVYAGLGMGLVSVYKCSGVINFAQASLGLWGAFTFDELHRTGRLVLPVGTIDLGAPLPVTAAVAIGVLSSAVLGGLVYLVVFRPLGRATLLAQIMGSIGVFMLVQTLLVRRFGNDARQVDPILPSKPISVGTVGFPVDRLWLAGLTLLIAGLVAAFYRYTLLGLATRAGAEDEDALRLSRWSPPHLAIVNWVMGSAITALLLTLASPITSLNPASIGMLIVPGLAAMLVGRLSSVLAAALAGLALGAVESILTYTQVQPWWPHRLPSGLVDAVPFVVVAIALVASGSRLPGRGAVVTARLPAVVRQRLRPRVLVASTAAVAIMALVLGPSERNGLIVSMIMVVVALSFVVLVGLVGQVSLGQAGTAGISAFVLARYTDFLPFPVSIVLSALAGTIVGVVMGLPALRVRGAQLAVITLAGAVAIQSVVLNNAATSAEQLTVTRPRLGPLDLAVQKGDSLARIPFIFAVLLVVAVCCWAVSRLITGRTGRRFLAVRSNERAAAATGIDVAGVKLSAFAVASFLAGIGGGLLAYSQGAVSAGSFTFFAGLTFLVYAFLGGITSVSGALLAGVIAPLGLGYVLVNNLVHLGSIYDLLGGVAMIIAAIFQPEGAAALLSARLQRFRRQSATKPPPVDGGGIAVPAAHSTGLDVTSLSVRYGGVQAVRDVSLRLEPGAIHGLIGPNGAGKTSVLDAIAGFAPATGEIVLGDARIDDRSPHRRFTAGLARTWQASDLFTDLTVLDNLLVAARPARVGDLARDIISPPRRETDANWALHLLGIHELAHRMPDELSTGEQRLVGVARALAGRPAVLLADEPAAGLDTDESVELGRHLRTVAASGVAILLVEHDLPLVLDVCDTVTVLSFGSTIASGSPAEVRSHPAVRTAYLGEPAVGGERTENDNFVEAAGPLKLITHEDIS